MTTRTAVVLGASLAGLFTAAALARNGYRVTVLERDELPDTPSPRKGVPQGAQVHVLLEQGWQAAERVLPGLREEVSGQGAARFDSGRMPWLSEYGWLDTRVRGFDFVSVTRPLLELIVRWRVQQLPGVTLRSAELARGLLRDGGRWRVTSTSGEHTADLVVDASGRSSRLPAWLTALGLRVPPPELLDAHFGYATRLYAAPVPLPLRTGVVIGGTPETGTGGLAMPVEHGRWLLMGGGYADRRPPRDAAGFHRFLAKLRDPVLARLADRLEPITDVAVHRQTGNRRYRFDTMIDWPAGLLVVGDAAAAFNPVYGQGISVAAGQAAVLQAALASGAQADRRLQEKLSEVADLPWSIATSADLRHPSADHPTPGPRERLFGAWVERVARLTAAGDPAATVVAGQVYNLTAPPALLFHPFLVGGVLRSLVAPPRSLPRPAVLDAFGAESDATGPTRRRSAA